jgi:hypothetical protein
MSSSTRQRWYVFATTTNTKLVAEHGARWLKKAEVTGRWSDLQNMKLGGFHSSRNNIIINHIKGDVVACIMALDRR